ncbi:MAG: hypothetical protein LDL41_22520 [Coleofasciculus sp. S288]|nr:hypothetical protein [Coleofasciculus sp. S288]
MNPYTTAIMLNEFRQIFPTPPPAADIFATYQLAHEFYREAEYRQEHERYCEWYRQTVKRHRQEFQKMQGDINIFGWFCRRKD